VVATRDVQLRAVELGGSKQHLDDADIEARQVATGICLQVSSTYDSCDWLKGQFPGISPTQTHGADNSDLSCEEVWNANLNTLLFVSSRRGQLDGIQLQHIFVDLSPT
jgi:hypothetical protein